MEDTQRNSHMYMCRRRVGCGFFYFFSFSHFSNEEANVCGGRRLWAEAEALKPQWKAAGPGQTALVTALASRPTSHVSSALCR